MAGGAVGIEIWIVGTGELLSGSTCAKITQVEEDGKKSDGSAGIWISRKGSSLHLTLLSIGQGLKSAFDLSMRG